MTDQLPPPKPHQPSTRATPLSFWRYLAIFFAMLLLVGYTVWDDRQTHYAQVFIDSYYHLSYALSLQQPQLFAMDSLLASLPGSTSAAERAYQAYPLYFWLLRLGMPHWGFEGTLSLMQAVTGLIYLTGAFRLLYHWSGRPWISLVVAGLSAVVAPVFPGERWGVLSISMMLPGTLFLALSPWLFDTWLRTQGQRQPRVWFFLGQGVAGVLHPLSWFTVTGSMLLAEWISLRCRTEALKERLALGLISLIPLLPFAIQWFFTHPDPEMTLPERIKTLQYMLNIFLPIRWEGLWLIRGELLGMFGWAVTVGWAIVALRRHLIAIPSLPTHFATGSLLLFIGAMLLNNLVLIPNQMAFIDGYRNLKYLFLPAMLLLALGLSQFSGLAALSRTAGCILLLGVLNIPLLWQSMSQNPLGFTQHAALQWAHFVAPVSESRIQEQQELNVLAHWLAQHTDVQSTLLHVSTDSLTVAYRLRALSQRSLLHTWADAGPLYLHNRRQLLTWGAHRQHLGYLYSQYGLCSSPEAIWASTQGATHLICPTPQKESPTQAPPVYVNPSFSVYRLSPDTGTGPPAHAESLPHAH